MLVFLRSLYLKNLTCFLSLLKQDHFHKNYSNAKLLNMNEAFLRYNEDSNKFGMSLRYIDPNLNVDKQFNFLRNVDEPISKFIFRIKVNINNYIEEKMKKKYKKMKKDGESFDDMMNKVKIETIKFLKDDCVLDEDVACKSILTDPLNIKLIIFNTEYILKQNVPFITKINLPLSILVGFPIYPSKFETQYVDKEKSTFNWYKKQKNEWIHVGENYMYVPNVFDVGCKLKMICIPRNETQVGPLIEIVSTRPVEVGPGPCPFEIRHSFTKNKLLSKSFRITSYNILATMYSETDLSKDTLFPYCPRYALSMDYRKSLILKELIGYNADIMCLQEVDTGVYTNDLMPALHSLNYDSIHNLKNDMQEGLAIFYNRDRFDKLNSDYSVIKQNTDLVEFNSIWLQIENENAKQTFLNRNTIIQSVILQSKENSEILIVGNTHLYFRQNADHIRLLQAYYGLMYLQKFAKEIKERNPECNVSIIYCGDFNSVPENGVYQLMTQKYIPKDHVDWKCDDNERIENVSLKHDFNLSSACGTPQYTNYTAAFSGCLDYIFYEKNYLEVEQIIPMPSEDELSLHTGLPSVVFPSDHISICADLKWTK